MYKGVLSVLATALLAATALVASSMSTAGAVSQVDVPIGVDVNVAPSVRSANAYDCVLTISDLQSGKALAAPEITARLGQKGGVSNRMADGTSLEASVSVDAAGTAAEYEVALSRDGMLKAKHSGHLVLRR